jgi:photosystem II stability/assembly factor-like uncharacterized protein
MRASHTSVLLLILCLLTGCGERRNVSFPNEDISLSRAPHPTDPDPGVPVINMTTDGGKSWQVKQVPFYTETAAVICPSISTCYLTSDTGIYASSDGGITWVAQEPSGFHARHSISCVTTTTCAVANGSGLTATTDGGATWHEHRYDLMVDFDATAISCPSSKTCVVVGWNSQPASTQGRRFETVLATRDGGYTWQVQSIGSRSGLSGVSCPTEESCFAVGYDVTEKHTSPGRSGTIVATTDGGATWTKQSSNQTSDLWDISCPNTTTCFAIGNVVLKTSDSGTTWQELHFPERNIYPYAISCPAVSTCFIAGSHNILTTTDGSQT